MLNAIPLSTTHRGERTTDVKLFLNSSSFIIESFVTRVCWVFRKNEKICKSGNIFIKFLCYLAYQYKKQQLGKTPKTHFAFLWKWSWRIYKKPHDHAFPISSVVNHRSLILYFSRPSLPTYSCIHDAGNRKKMKHVPHIHCRIKLWELFL